MHLHDVLFVRITGNRDEAVVAAVIAPAFQVLLKKIVSVGVAPAVVHPKPESCLLYIHRTLTKMLAATALSTCRPAGLTAPRRAARPARRSQLTTRAMAPVEILQLAADAAPGTVDAPFGAIIIGELAGGGNSGSAQPPVAAAALCRLSRHLTKPLLMPAGAVVVTGLSFALTLALKPGKAARPPAHACLPGCRPIARPALHVDALDCEATLQCDTTRVTCQRPERPPFPLSLVCRHRRRH